MTTRLAIKTPINTHVVTIVVTYSLNVGAIDDFMYRCIYRCTEKSVDNFWGVLNRYFINRLLLSLSSNKKIAVNALISLSTVVFS